MSGETPRVSNLCSSECRATESTSQDELSPTRAAGAGVVKQCLVQSQHDRKRRNHLVEGLEDGRRVDHAAARTAQVHQAPGWLQQLYSTTPPLGNSRLQPLLHPTVSPPSSSSSSSPGSSLPDTLSLIMVSTAAMLLRVPQN